MRTHSISIRVIGIISFLILLLSSCNKINSSKTTTTIETDSLNPLPTGFEIGEVKAYIGKNKVEKNLISQINSYNKALLRNDINNARIYLYPDAINYFKKNYPKESSTDEIIKEIFKGASGIMVRMDSIYSASGVEMSLVVCDIYKQIDLGQTKLITFDFSMQLYKEDSKKEKFLHSKPLPDGKTLGITLNNGMNWTFLAINDDTPNILRLKFSQDIINQVMGY